MKSLTETNIREPPFKLTKHTQSIFIASSQLLLRVINFITPGSYSSGKNIVQFLKVIFAAEFKCLEPNDYTVDPK